MMVGVFLFLMPAAHAQQSFTYDDNGNMTSDGVYEYEWDYGNRLRTVRKLSNAHETHYVYDPGGQRVSKWSMEPRGNGLEKVETVYVSPEYEEVLDSALPGGKLNRVHIYVQSVLIATVEEDGAGNSTTYYHHSDELGGTDVVTDEQGSIVQVVDEYPYGKNRVNEQRAAFGTAKQFTGHVLDDEIGHYYMGSRYYRPELGRFLSPDPASRFQPELFLEDPQQLNWYSYARNNPVKYVDPTGESIEGYTAFSLGSAFLKLGGLNISAQFLSHATRPLFSNEGLLHTIMGREGYSNASGMLPERFTQAPPLNFDESSNVAKAIMGSREYQETILPSIKEKIESGTYKGTGSIEFNSDKDLHYSLKTVGYNFTAEQGDSWNYQVKVDFNDTYDFTQLFGESTWGRFSKFANDIGFWGERSGELKKFDVRIKTRDTVAK